MTVAKKRPSDRLQARFQEFWEAGESNFKAGQVTTPPLFALRDNWDYWWSGMLNAAQRVEIQNLVKERSVPGQEDCQKEFVGWVQGWLTIKYGRAGAGHLVLTQLAGLEIFQSWQELQSLRLGEGNCVHAIFLRKNFGGGVDDVTPLQVFLLPRKEDETFFKLINLDLSAAALEHVHTAVGSLLCGWGLFRISFLIALLGWKQRVPWLRRSLAAGWLSVLMVVAFLLAGPPLGRDVLAPLLAALYVFAAAIFSVSVFGCCRELIRSFRLASLFRRSRVCVMAGGENAEGGIDANGPSFGVALALGSLLALADEMPLISAESWLWGHLFKALKSSASRWAATGELCSNGWIRKVDRLDDKLKAVLKQPMISDFFIPFQSHSLEDGVHRPGQSENPLRLHRSWRLETLLLKAGCFCKPTGIICSMVTGLSMLALCAAWSDVHRILVPSQPPELVFWKCEWVHYERLGNFLLLTFRAGQPSLFWARLVRPMGPAPDSVPLRRDEAVAGQATAVLATPNASRSDLGCSDDVIEVVQPHTLLWRRMKEKVVLRAPVWGILEKAERDNTVVPEAFRTTKQ